MWVCANNVPSDGVSASLFYSPNGQSWFPAVLPADCPHYNITAVAPDGHDRWKAVGYAAAGYSVILASTDGIHWTVDQEVILPGASIPTDLTYSKGYWVIGGDHCLVTTEDGSKIDENALTTFSCEGLISNQIITMALGQNEAKDVIVLTNSTYPKTLWNQSGPTLDTSEGDFVAKTMAVNDDGRAIIAGSSNYTFNLIEGSWKKLPIPLASVSKLMVVNGIWIMAGQDTNRRPAILISNDGYTWIASYNETEQGTVLDIGVGSDDLLALTSTGNLVHGTQRDTGSFKWEPTPSYLLPRLGGGQYGKIVFG